MNAFLKPAVLYILGVYLLHFLLSDVMTIFVFVVLCSSSGLHQHQTFHLLKPLRVQSRLMIL